VDCWFLVVQLDKLVHAIIKICYVVGDSRRVANFPPCWDGVIAIERLLNIVKLFVLSNN
jgi:hypothetical protein